MSDEIIDIEEEEEPTTLRYKISSYGADYPVDSLVKRLNKDIIYLPEFQRHYVWSITQASKFIESLLLGLPVPGIFLSKVANTNKMEIIDGQQRLKTLEYFYNGKFKGDEFKLTGITSQFDKMTYNTLKPEDRQVLDDSIIHTTIIKQDEPENDDSSIYYIFERLNTGGTLLRPQEIRACIFHGSFNKLLSELESDQNWIKIYGKPDNRLKSQETILRFFAFLFYIGNYNKPMKEFLNQYMKKNREFKLQKKDELENIFRKSVRYIEESLGFEAFRPKGQIVASVIDSVMVSTAKMILRPEIIDKQIYIERYRKLITDVKYLESVNNATSDEKMVIQRFNISEQYLIG